MSTIALNHVPEWQTPWLQQRVSPSLTANADFKCWLRIAIAKIIAIVWGFYVFLIVAYFLLSTFLILILSGYLGDILNEIGCNVIIEVKPGYHLTSHSIIKYPLLTTTNPDWWAVVSTLWRWEYISISSWSLVNHVIIAIVWGFYVFLIVA